MKKDLDAVVGISIRPYKMARCVWCPWLLLSILAAAVSVFGGPWRSGGSLYTYQDPVNILYTANVTEFISRRHADGRTVQLVQFYNTYCGHCQAFAPLYKKFLHSTRKWSAMIDFSVLDCSEEENSAACRKYDVMSYPSLRWFWFRPAESDVGKEFHLKRWLSAQDMRHSVIKRITDDWSLGEIPSHWPHFPPLTGETREELVKQLQTDPSDRRTILLVVEEIGSFFGRELMMNFSKHTDVLKIFRMEESSAKLLDQIHPDVLEQEKLPFLFSIGADDRNNFQVVARPDHSHESVYEYYPKLIRKKFLHLMSDEDEKSESAGSKDAKNEHSESEKVPYSSRIYMSDLHNAIRFSLFHEVPLKKQLTRDQVQALIRFLNVLQTTFPFPNEKTVQFIKHLHDWLVKHSNGRSKLQRPIIDVQDMLTTMNMYEEYYHFPEMKPWRACADVSPNRKRSHPCSLWTLFHVLTVAEYRHSMQTKQWLSLHPALYAMREYIKHFFGCTECARHFGEMAATLENDLTLPNSSVLWLWRAHNRVNARLKGSPSEDHRLPKRQFPTYQECSRCYRKEPPVELYENYTAYLPYYDQERTLQFLVDYYGVERIVLDDDEANIENEALDIDRMDHHNHHRTAVTNHATMPRSKILQLMSSPLSQTDISLIFVFYVVSIILLVSICGYVKMRRNFLFKVFSAGNVGGGSYVGLSSNKQRSLLY